MGDSSVSFVRRRSSLNYDIQAHKPFTKIELPMKNKLYYLFSVAAMLICFQLRAQTSEETRSLQSFSAVKVANAIEAELIKGDKNEVHIAASGIALDRVSTSIDKQTLEIKISGSNSGASVKVKITYKDINELSASTAAKVFVKNPLSARTIKINAATSSYVEAEVDSHALVLEAATNAKIFVKGSTETLDLKAFTNAEINGEGLDVDEANVRVNTAANATFTVNESITGTAATAGKVYYKGDPNYVDVKTNTGGAIERN